VSTPVPGERRGGLQLIARAADVLRALEQRPEGMGLSELALAVGLPKSTVHRLVGALEHEDFVHTADARIRLGRGLARLGAATRGALRQELHVYLLRLAQDLDETVDLSVLDGSTIRFIDQVPSTRRLRAVSAVGTSFPLHCTAPGKALLAAMPADQAAAILPARLAAFTPATITTKRDLWAELETVRATGVAYDREEHTEGIAAVGAVVRDAYGVAAAISVPVPSQRFAGREDELAERVLAVCAEAAVTLGG
jgi:DNA-binding IclR family transcriptional regulator